MDRILLGHGAGGRLMHSLIREHFSGAFGMAELLDAARLSLEGRRVAMSTDSYVVKPLFFPGGDIGELSVYGTVNDLSMVGARPLCLTVGFILEEGLPLEDLRRIVASMARAAQRAGVALVAGDTKVVERGKGDGMFINTAGLGLLPEGLELVPSRMSPGDVVILSGPVGEHGIAVMAERNGLSFEPPLRSDTRPLNDLVQKMLQAGEGLKVLRDPTRGGLATTLKELALQSGLNILVREEDIPVSPQVRGAAELLGLDPLYVACEGVLVAVAGAPVAEYLLALMREHPDGVQARAIGEVLPPEGSEPRVVLQTAIGGQRMLEMLLAEQLPRIC